MLAGSAEMCNNNDNNNNSSKVLLEHSYIVSERLTNIESKIHVVCGIYEGYKYEK